MKKITWISWLVVSIALASYFGKALLVDEDKSEFLIGEASHGHFQIEMACESCHTSPFGGEDILQEACVNCHGEDLELAHDSHPKKKFTDPREAYRIKILDARYCVSCHTEHQKEQTNAMGVTVPDDYCYHCHQEVGEERESHKDLPFDSCASAGCHNYHDNRALYESFLVENSGQAWLKEVAKIAQTNANEELIKEPVDFINSAYAEKITLHPDIAQHWQASSHAKAGVDCGGCHTSNESTWIEKPGLSQCENCHKREVKGFTEGKHGMRMAKGLSQALKPITPAQSQLNFSEKSANMEHGCNACHQAHDFNTQKAATDSCLSCHADEHSLAFNDSPHGQLWQQEVLGTIEKGEGVSCASCHMPRMQHPEKKDGIIYVEHNQNFNLRPNEKMIRTVCMDCHGLEFSIDALADPELIKNNFNGKPGTHIESVDWAKKRDQKD